MDFAIHPQHDRLRRELEDLGRRVGAGAAERDRTGTFPREAWDECGKAGLQGLPVPEEYGGRGASPLAAALALEAFGRACPDEGLAFSISAHMQTCAVPLWRFGTEEQRAHYLPALCTGRWIGGNATSEPTAGSDVSAITTSAERDGDHYVLHGVKSFVTNGPVADLIVVYALTNPEYRQFGGLSAFLVEAGDEGVSIGRNVEKVGLRSAPWCEVRLEGCRVSPERRLGEEGDGMEIFHSAMRWERTLLPAIALGRMEATLDRSLAYARERKQFGRPIGKHQAIAHRIVEMKADLEAARLLLYRAAWLFGRGERALLETSLAKLVVTESRLRSSLAAVQIHGARGCETDFEVEREVRNSLPGTVSSGTSEIQRQIVARCLGL